MWYSKACLVYNFVTLSQLIDNVLFCHTGNEYKKGVEAGRVDSQMFASVALSHCRRAKQANRMLKEATVWGEKHGGPPVFLDDWHRMRKVAE